MRVLALLTFLFLSGLLSAQEQVVDQEGLDSVTTTVDNINSGPETGNIETPELSNSTSSMLPGAKVTVSEASNWPFVMLTLLGMVACILIIAWLVKRFAGLSGIGGRDLKVVSAVALGARERIAIVDVRGEQFLVGVTPQNINLLHHFDEAPIAPIKGASSSDFAQKLQHILQQNRPDRSVSGNESERN